MAITRRQFVATLGSVAAALGLSQADLTKITEAFADPNPIFGGGKPKVIWVHGAECTGCSTSVVGLFEDAAQNAVIDPNDASYGTTVAAALGLIDADVPRTLNGAGFNVDDAMNAASGGHSAVTIGDILIDWIDLQYHETVMGPGGDMAYLALADNMYNNSADPFVLVVEGAVQVFTDAAAWSGTGSTINSGDAPWCAIGASGDQTDRVRGAGAKSRWTGNAGELSFDEVVKQLATQANCVAVIAVGQCATYGGYPGCVSPAFGKSQTPAYGVYDFLKSHAGLSPADAETNSGKVVNVPGCPTNPWWFVLTVVLYLVDFVNGPAHTPAQDGPLGIVGSDMKIKGGVDYGRRLVKVFPTTIHNGLCPRYDSWKAGKFAANPGDSGCLMKLGCKGISTKGLCSAHGWNGLGPANPTSWDQGVSAVNGKGSAFCVAAGAPCMGCTEKGYPDAQVPFVKLF